MPGSACWGSFQSVQRLPIHFDPGADEPMFCCEHCGIYLYPDETSDPDQGRQTPPMRARLSRRA
jgi:hypothetical protein